MHACYFQCRDILKNTYIYGFYMFEPSNLQSESQMKVIPHFATEAEVAAAKSQFEFYQEDLESTTGRCLCSYVCAGLCVRVLAFVFVLVCAIGHGAL